MDESCRIAAALFGEKPETTWNGVSRPGSAEEDQYARHHQGESGAKQSDENQRLILETRKVYLSPPTYHPHEQWVQPQARNVLIWLEDNGLAIRFVVHDRDAKFSFGFDRVFANAGIRRVRTPLLAPDANAYAESWIGSLKRECLNHFLCFSLAHLDHITSQFVRFYNAHRPHQSLGNRTLPEAATGPPEELAVDPPPQLGRVRCQRFLGGLLRHYYRAAA